MAILGGGRNSSLPVDTNNCSKTKKMDRPFRTAYLVHSVKMLKLEIFVLLPYHPVAPAHPEQSLL